MLLRDRRSLVNVAAAVMACIAMLVYAFASPGTHAPNLHATASVAADGGHSHDHGDHSHDDLDFTSYDPGVSDHHHADHTHEKAGLVEAAGYGLRNSLPSDFAVLAQCPVGGPPYGIDRPPRTVTFI